MESKTMSFTYRINENDLGQWQLLRPNYSSDVNVPGTHGTWFEIDYTNSQSFYRDDVNTMRDSIGAQCINNKYTIIKPMARQTFCFLFGAKINFNWISLRSSVLMFCLRFSGIDLFARLLFNLCLSFGSSALCTKTEHWRCGDGCGWSLRGTHYH